MRIKIKNYQIIKDIDLELKDITIVTGLNNQGKSALIRAIRAICFGQLGDKYIRNGQDQCSVFIETDEAVFGWERIKNDANYILDGNKTATKKPFDEFINKLNIKAIDISKTNSLLPNFSFQFDHPLFLLSLGPVERANALSFLFSGQKFPQLLKNIAASIKDQKKNLAFIEGEISQKEKTVADTESKTKIYENFKPLFSERQNLLSYYSVIKELQDKETELNSISGIVKNVSSELAVIKNRVQVLDQIKEGMLDKIFEIEKDFSVLAELDRDIVRVKNDIEKISAEAQKVDSKISEIVEKMGGVCPLCGNEIGEDKKKTLLS